MTVDARWALLQPLVDNGDHPLHLTAIRLSAGTPSGLNQLLARNPSRDELGAACGGADIDAMTAEQRIELLTLVADIQPLADDPPLTGDWSSSDVSQTLREGRDALVQRLAQLGQVEALLALESQRPGSERWYWRSYVVQARQAAADAVTELPSPSEVLQLLGATDARFVRNDQDVVDLVLAALDQVQLDVRAGGWQTLWHHGDEPRPQSEDYITDQIARRIDEEVLTAQWLAAATGLKPRRSQSPRRSALQLLEIRGEPVSAEATELRFAGSSDLSGGAPG